MANFGLVSHQTIERSLNCIPYACYKKRQSDYRTMDGLAKKCFMDKMGQFQRKVLIFLE